jgi:hypothetical protein
LSGLPSTASGTVPATIHSLSSRAVPARNAWIGPPAALSACGSLSRSRAPMKAKFSGSTASRAPACAAWRSWWPAAARLRATSSIDLIWMAAALTFIILILAHWPAQAAARRRA